VVSALVGIAALLVLAFRDRMRPDLRAADAAIAESRVSDRASASAPAESGTRTGPSAREAVSQESRPSWSSYPNGCYITAQAFGPDNAPIAGVDVDLESLEMSPNEPALITTQRTNSEGVAHFDLAGVTGAIRFYVRATGPAYSSDRVAAQRNSTINLSCDPCSTLRVSTRVKGAGAAARVVATELTDANGHECATRLSTDSRGIGNVALRAGRRYEIGARTGRAWSIPTVIEVPAGARSAAIDLNLSEDPVDVWVRTDKTSSPVRGVQLYLDGDCASVGESDDEGKIAVLGILNDRGTDVHVRVAGEFALNPERWTRDANGRQICVVSELALDLRRIEALVVDPQSRPIQGAAVGWALRCGAFGFGQTLTDRNGLSARLWFESAAGDYTIAVHKDGFEPRIVGLESAAGGPTRVVMTPALPYRVRVSDQESNPLPFAFVGIRWRDGRSEALVSYVGDHQGYAEVYAPEGAKIAAQEAAGSGSSEEQALDPTHRDVTLEVEASPPDEVSGVIEPPPDSQRSGPYLVTLNSSRGASERVVVAERTFAFRRHFGRNVVITVVDRATGATGNYDGEPKGGIVITLKSPIGITVEPIASDGKERPISNVFVDTDSDPTWRAIPFSKSADGWLVKVPSRGTWNLRVESGAMRGYVEGLAVAARPGEHQRIKVRLAPRTRLEVELAAGLELTDLGVYLRRRLPSDAASIKSIRPCEIRDVTADPGGQIILEDILPGVYNVAIVGLRGTDEQWIAAAEEVRVAGSQVSRCAVWSAQRRRVSLRYKGGEDPSALVGLRLVPVDRFEWLGSFLSIDDEGGVHALLWPGRFKICDVSGSVLYNITVAEGDDVCVVEPVTGK
jgi:hypothetical protein